jgi:hypothetical protein
MKKIIAFGLLIAGFAVVSQAQTAGQTAENTPAIEVVQVAPATAVAPTKACCKKEGSAAGCSKAGASNGEVKACCKKEGSAASASVSAPATVAPKAACSGASAEHKCGGHGDASASASASAAAPIAAPGVAPKKACASGAEGKPCCKK